MVKCSNTLLWADQCNCDECKAARNKTKVAEKIDKVSDYEILKKDYDELLDKYTRLESENEELKGLIASNSKLTETIEPGKGKENADKDFPKSMEELAKLSKPELEAILIKLGLNQSDYKNNGERVQSILEFLEKNSETNE